MAGFAQIGRSRLWPLRYAAFWADATCLFDSYSRPPGVVGRRRAYRERCARVALAGCRPSSDRAAVSRAAHPLLDRPPWHRHCCRGYPARRARRRNCALCRNRRRPRGTVDRPRGRAVVKLRAGVDHAQARRCRAARRPDRHGNARPLLEPVRALRGAARRRVSVAAVVSRRGAAFGVASHARRFRGGAVELGNVRVSAVERCSVRVRRGGAPSRSSL